MCSDKDIYLSRLQILCNLSCLLCALRAVEILHLYRHISQSLIERAVVLQCKDCRRYKYCHLLAIYRRLKCSADSDLSLTKAHIATDKSIHRAHRLHIALHRLDSSLLVRCLLIAERRLHSLLQITIRRECKALACLTLCIEGNKLSRYIFDSLLGRALELLPSTTAQLMHLWSLAIATLVTRYAVERVNIDKEHIAISIYQLNHLPRLSSRRVRQRHKTVKATHAVVNMDNIVANPQCIEFGNGHLLVTLNLAINLVTTVAVKYLMLRIETQSGVVIDKTLM